jgi:hypothetical protein
MRADDPLCAAGSPRDARQPIARRRDEMRRSVAGRGRACPSRPRESEPDAVLVHEQDISPVVIKVKKLASPESV